MLAGMSAGLLREWMEYFKRRPFGEKRADLRAGIVSAAVILAMTGKKVNPADFMPQFGGRRTQQSADEAEHVFRNHARLVGRYMERQGKRG